MEQFNQNGLVMKFVTLVLEFENHKKKYAKLKAENQFLRERLQTKLPFEARV